MVIIMKDIYFYILSETYFCFKIESVKEGK